MNKISLINDNTTLDALLLKPINPTRAVLFAVGSGGNPERHYSFLHSLYENGCLVIAPYFERLKSTFASEEELRLRATFLKKALDAIEHMSLPIIGIGHSIGATLLLAMSGEEMWLKSGIQCQIEFDSRLNKLILFAPPTDFFRAPHALKAVSIPLQIWVGSIDLITPVKHVELIIEELPASLLDIHVIEGAGHFSFMNDLPPNIIDTMPNRENFLLELSKVVTKFVCH